MASIRFEHIAKRYGETGVLADLNLEIADREFFTFVGPSGCGKSTILSLIAGLEPVSGGRLLFDERPVNHLSPGDRDVAMVFQSYALYPHLTVFENVAFPLKVRKVPRGEIGPAVQGVARILGLEDYLHRKPRELSGGQRQRVALGRALVRKPKAFLMDEPLSNLDARLRIEMRTELKRLHTEFPITTVYVTHDQEEAMALSDRIAVLSGGALQQLGSPAEIYNRPANRFVAEFIGSPPMNLVDGSLLAGVTGFADLLEQFQLSDTVLGVRPADMAVSCEPAPRALEGLVQAVEPLGSVTWVDGLWSGVRLKGYLAPQAGLAPGDKAFFQVPIERLHPFNKADGRRR